MSDQDKILGIVKELNIKKNDIVKNMSVFIKEGKELVQKTTKEQGKAEEMLKIVRGIEKYGAVNIPVIQMNNNVVPKSPTVKINYPTNGLKFEFGKDIKLEFETTNVKTPFMYYIIGKEKTASNPFPIKAFRSNNSKVLLNSIKENDKNLLPIGTYTIMVQILDSHKKPLTPPDQVTIEVIPATNGPVITNSITITSPTATHSPYKSQPIPITFSVAGPYHDAAKDYVYQIEVANSKGAVFTENGQSKDKDVIHANQLTTLPDDQYKIRIITGDLTTKTMLTTKPAEEIFIIQTGKGPTPTPPKKKKGYAVYNLIIDGNSHVGSGNFNTVLTKNTPISFGIENSGTAGNLKWTITKKDWLNIYPTKGVLNAGAKQDIIVSLDYIKYTQKGSPKSGIIIIEGFAGARPIAQSYIVLTIQ